jgi:hypothetical protein
VSRKPATVAFRITHHEKEDRWPGILRPFAGFGVFCLYVTIALACRFALIKRRDA